VPGTGEVARFPAETLGTHKDGNTEYNVLLSVFTFRSDSNKMVTNLAEVTSPAVTAMNTDRKYRSGGTCPD
jgi:hypothetical protein